MPLVPLERQSEPYSMYGNISADGASKLLGTPDLDRLQIVIRESVQNSWDARREGVVPEYKVRLRELSEGQTEFLKNVVLEDLPPEPERDDDGRPFEGRMVDLVSGWARRLMVMEICDYNTSGLCGPTDPGEAPLRGEPTDFVDFLRNIGTPRDKHQGGGTYGYGKTSLYATSRCQTIIVDTLARYQNNPVRRFVASRLGHRYDAEDGTEHKRRFTGRHWWGAAGHEDHLEPITGDDACCFSSELGFMERASEDFGTSIMILDPDLGHLDLNASGLRIVESLLWHFWPKMIEDDLQTSMNFKVEVNGNVMDIPHPLLCPPLDHYIRALSGLKNRSEGVKLIQCGKPQKNLGCLYIAHGLKNSRNPRFSRENGIISETSHHVALMRPAELIVKYLPGNPMPDDAFEWGGVFICDSDETVERAFAHAEPPAHDDWNPEYLSPRSKDKTFVSVALRKIKEAMRSFSQPQVSPPENGFNVSAGGLADAIGRIIPGTGGQRSGRRVSTGGGGDSSPRSIRISRLEFIDHIYVNEIPCARFQFRLKGPEGVPVIIRARPGIVMDGGSIEQMAPNGQQPEVICWINSDGEHIGTDPSLEMRCQNASDLQVAVKVPDYVAVNLSLSVSES